MDVEIITDRPPEYDDNTIEADLAQWPALTEAGHDLGDEGVEDPEDYAEGDPPGEPDDEHVVGA